MFLDELPIYGDEPFSIFHAQGSLVELLKTLSKDRNPPLYFIFLWGWIKCFGIGTIATKSLSVLFSVISSVLLFLFARRHLTLSSGVFASLCFLFSDTHFDISHEIRSHAMVICLSIMCMWLFFELLFKPQQTSRYALALGICNAALIYTHYIAGFLVLAQFCIWVLFYKKKTLNTLFFYVFGLPFLLVLPWLGIIYSNIPKAGEFWLETPDLTALLYVFEKLLEDVRMRKMIGVSLLVLMGLSLMFRSKIFAASYNAKKSWMLLAAFLVPILVCFWVAQFTPVFRLKYVVYSSVFAFLLLGYLISSLRLPWHLSSALLLPFLAHMYTEFFPANRGIENWPATAQKIQELKDDQTGVFIIAGYKHRDFAYYYNKEWFARPKELSALLEKNNIYPIYTVDQLKQKNISRFKKLLLIQSHHLVVDPKNSVETYLKNEFSLCRRLTGRSTAKILLFNAKQNPCDHFKHVSEYRREPSSCVVFDSSIATDSSAQLKQIRYFSDLENLNCLAKLNLTDQMSFSDSASNVVNKTNKFSITLEKTCSNLVEVKGTLKVFLPSKCDVVLVADYQKEGIKIARQERYVLEEINELNKWVDLSFNFDFSDLSKKNGTLKLYLWNKHDCEVYIDDLDYSIITNLNSF